METQSACFLSLSSSLQCPCLSLYGAAGSRATEQRTSHYRQPVVVQAMSTPRNPRKRLQNQPLLPKHPMPCFLLHRISRRPLALGEQSQPRLCPHHHPFFGGWLLWLFFFFGWLVGRWRQIISNSISIFEHEPHLRVSQSIWNSSRPFPIPNVCRCLCVSLLSLFHPCVRGGYDAFCAVTLSGRSLQAAMTTAP